MKTNSTQIREFKTDNNLIYHLIDSQKTDFSSAITELVQNSFDAGSTQCNINYEAASGKLTVTDNGTGLRDEEEIEAYFGTFGTPHTEDNSEKFGRFRIGRSQIFSFGKNIWNSNEFILTVDIKNRGLTYSLEKTSQLYKGCKIEIQLYNDDITQRDHLIRIDSLRSALRRKFSFLRKMEITFNNEVINSEKELLKSGKILKENDYFLFIETESSSYTKNNIAVYNLGIFTKNVFNFPKLNGILITKKHLKLDVSRRELLPGDIVWDECSNYLKELSHIKKTNPVSKINVEEIVKLIFTNGISVEEILSIAIFKEIISGKTYSVNSLIDGVNDFAFCNYSNERDERIKLRLDKIKQLNKVVLLESSVLCSAWCDVYNVQRYNPDDVYKDLKTYFQEAYNSILAKEELEDYDSNPFRDKFSEKLEKLVEKFNDVDDYWELTEDHYIIEEDNLKKDELIILQALNKTGNNYLLNGALRKIRFGYSTTAEAWTDGESYIAINIKWVKGFKSSKSNLFYIALLLVHEYTHEKGSTDLHDFSFYEKFHSTLLDEYNQKQITWSRYGGKKRNIFTFYESFWRVYFTLLKTNDLKIPSYLLGTSFDKNITEEKIYNEFKDRLKVSEERTKNERDRIQDIFELIENLNNRISAGEIIEENSYKVLFENLKDKFSSYGGEYQYYLEHKSLKR